MIPSQKPPWPEVGLGDILTERTETPDPGEIEAAMISVIAKISFSQGTIELRDDTKTRTKMILVRPGDLVVSGINAAKGAIAIYDEEEGTPITATIHYAAYIPDKSRVDVRYLWWLLRSETFRGILKQNLPGGVKTELKAKRLLPIQIPLPPVDEQRRIVARIEELAALIEEAQGLRGRAQQETGVVMAAALQNVFSSVAMAGCKSGLLGDEDIAEIIMGQSPPSYTYNDRGEGLPFFQGTSDFGSLFPKARKWCNEPKKVAMENDVLLAVRAPVGPTNVCREECCIGRGLAAIRPKSPLHHKFLLYFLRWIESDLVSQAKGSTFTAIKKSHLQEIAVPLPALSQQSEVIAYLDGLQAQVDELVALQDATQAELDALLPSVLDRAFRGSC